MRNLKHNLKFGYGTSAGRRAQLVAYQNLCHEALFEIERIEKEIAKHKNSITSEKGYEKGYGHDEELWESVGLFNADELAC